jgi:hypothetical protein
MSRIERGFGDLLARARYRHTSFLIRREKTVVAKLAPVEAAGTSGADAAKGLDANAAPRNRRIRVLRLTLRNAIGAVALLLALTSITLSVLGVHRMSTGLGMSKGTKILVFICLFIPLVGPVALVVLNVATALVTQPRLGPKQGKPRFQ